MLSHENPLIGRVQLEEYNNLLKEHIKSLGVGLTQEDVQTMIDDEMVNYIKAVYSDTEPENQENDSLWLQPY